MSVTRDSAITQADMDALADLANDGPVSGKPYSFPESGGWLTELSRLYRNALRLFRIGNNTPSLFNRAAIVSEKLPLISWPANQWTDCAIATGDSAGNLTLQVVVDDVDFYAASDVTKASFVMEAANGATVPVLNPPNGFLYQSIRYRFLVEFSNLTVAGSPVSSARFTGALRWIVAGGASYSLTGPNAGDFVVTPSGGIVTARIEKTVTGNFTFDVTISVSNYAAGSRGVYGQTITEPFTLTVENTTGTAVKALSPAKSWKKYAFNNIPLCSISALNGGAYSGNQATIRIYPDSTACPNLMVGRTFPVLVFDVIDGRNTPFGESNHDIAPAAKSITAANPDWGTVSVACEYLRPSYHTQLGTDPRETIDPVSKMAMPGSVINFIYIRRTPELVGDLYESVAGGALPVQIGRVKTSGQFEAFQTITIPSGSVDTTAEVFIPILSDILLESIYPSSKLAYVCAEDVQVFATVIAPSWPQIDTPRFLHDLTTAEVATPIVADHYNQIEALLEYISG